MNISTGEPLCLVDGENIEEVCKKLYVDKKTHVRKIGGYYYVIVPIKKIKTELELIQIV